MPLLRNSLETEITDSRMAMADALLCESAESSNSTGATARFMVSGVGEEFITSFTVSNVSSTVSKKWLMVVTCLQSHTLGQSGQSHGLSHTVA